MATDPTSMLRAQPSMFPEDERLIRLDEYQNWTKLTDRNERLGLDGLGFVLLGLFGEVGSVLSELKKKQRDKDSYIAYHDSAIEELGDAFWYFANASLRAGLSLSAIAERVPKNLGDWFYHGKATPQYFTDLQKPQNELTGPLSSDLVERRLLALAGKVGVLLDDFSSGRVAANGDALTADLVEIFRALLAAADDAAVSLNEAARRNIHKTFGRWPIERRWPPHYDESFDPDEQLPRHIEMIFKEKMADGKSYVLQQ
ncbi:MAG: nucleoside triphosphate pyrophosphohydrolase family protein [Alphaproteobacteria bacterium]